MANRSHIKLEQEKWLRFDANGLTKLVGEKQVKQGDGCSYRKVHYTKEDNFQKSFFTKQDHFKDPQLPLTDFNVQNLGFKRKVVLKRLFNLYPQKKDSLPTFFPTQAPLIKIYDSNGIPSFFTEINLFPPLHYKTLFITQQLQQNGLYHILINQQGRFETDVVDDYIPVYQDTEEPIWEMDLEHPWQLILLKFWAKKLKGYDRVQYAKPFEFIECFSNSNWKYFNVGREGLKFLEYYSKSQRIQNGKFILKTRGSNIVADSGLLGNCAGYQLINLQETGSEHSKTSDKKWTMAVRSTIKNKWIGPLSVVDEKINSVYKQKNFIRLERDFLITGEDFLNLFSSVYITARREKTPHLSSYYLLEVPPRNKKAVFLQFITPEAGFFDFTIKQWEKNKIVNEGRQRYLKNKYMLVEDTSDRDQKPSQYTMTPKYQIYSIQYDKGYNRGEAHFERVERGRYLMRIKPQISQKTSFFTINFCSNSKFFMKEIELDKKQTSQVMRNGMSSIIDKVPRVSLNKTAKYEQICFGNTFEQIGYGYIAIRSKATNPHNILLQVNPKKLNEEGFTLKNQFKKIDEPFGIIVHPGEITSLVLKRIHLSPEEYNWPPAAIGIFIQPK